MCVAVGEHGKCVYVCACVCMPVCLCSCWRRSYRQEAALSWPHLSVLGRQDPACTTPWGKKQCLVEVTAVGRGPWTFRESPPSHQAKTPASQEAVMDPPLAFSKSPSASPESSCLSLSPNLRGLTLLTDEGTGGSLVQSSTGGRAGTRTWSCWHQSLNRLPGPLPHAVNIRRCCG